MDKYLSVLELGEGATRADIKDAYRDLTKVWHPDRFAHDPKLQKRAEEKLKLINDAYRELRDYQPKSKKETKPTAPAQTEAEIEVYRELFADYKPKPKQQKLGLQYWLTMAGIVLFVLGYYCYFVYYIDPYEKHSKYSQRRR